MVIFCNEKSLSAIDIVFRASKVILEGSIICCCFLLGADMVFISYMASAEETGTKVSIIIMKAKNTARTVIIFISNSSRNNLKSMIGEKEYGYQWNRKQLYIYI